MFFFFFSKDKKEVEGKKPPVFASKLSALAVFTFVQLKSSCISDVDQHWGRSSRAQGSWWHPELHADRHTMEPICASIFLICEKGIIKKYPFPRMV